MLFYVLKFYLLDGKCNQQHHHQLDSATIQLLESNPGSHLEKMMADLSDLLGMMMVDL